jgi:hypothetical protein
MTDLWGLLSQLAGRPSTVWRLAWLFFCLVVMCLFGTQTLRKVVPYVLAGVQSEPLKALKALAELNQTAGQDEPGWFARIGLPLVSWLILVGVVALVFAHT